MDLGLSRMDQALCALGLQATAQSSTASGLSYKIIQVLGTNGKGSTSSFISSLACAHGLKTGLYTSPHFLSPRERVLINGRQLDEKVWVECANALIAVGGKELTYFEFLTVLAALAFQRAGVELAVFEAGLGGKNDATTSLPADLTVFTPIGLDHQQVIGPGLDDIARDKAAAVRQQPGHNGVTVVSAAQDVEVRAILQSECAAKQAKFISVDSIEALPLEILKGEAKLGLWGKHQFGNAALALTAWRCFCAENSIVSKQGAELKALQETWIAGRMQWITPDDDKKSPLFLLDGAHNPHGLRALGQSLAESGSRPAACIFACVADKDVEAITAHLRILCPAPIFVPPLPDNPRALPPQELAQSIGLSAIPVNSFEEALDKAVAQYKQTMSELPPGHKDRHPVLICGSLYLLAEFFKVYPELLDKPL